MTLTARSQALVDLVASMTGGSEAPANQIPVNPSTFIVPENTNQLLYGNPSGPVTASNVDSLQAINATVTLAQTRTGGNIPGLFSGGGNSMALWRFNAIINAGARSKSTSVVWNGVDDVNSARNKALEWANNLAYTFGNDAAAGTSDVTPSAKSPRVTFVRVLNAILPRRGVLLSTDPASTAYSGAGTGSGSNSYADFISTALAIRLQGTTTEGTPQVGYANHALLGVPDKVVIEGDQILLTAPVGVAPQTYGTFVALYLSYLTSPGNGFGFLMVPITEVKKPARAFTFVGGVWQMTVTAHGYTTNDRVRLTGANAPGFNGSYQITVIDVNTIAITNGPPSGVAVPTRANVRRYMLADGTRLGAFAQFAMLPGFTPSAPNLKVSKRNPAKPFTGVSFRKKTRRLH